MPVSNAKGRLVTVAAPADGVGPGALLRMRPWRARGFAARGREWVACVGSAAELRVEPGEDGDRFSRIARMAEELAAHRVYDELPGGGDRASGREPGAGGDRAPVRFYGGFAFKAGAPKRASDPGAGADLWRSFPDALFHLARLELEGDGRGKTVLRINEFVEKPGLETLRRLKREAGERRDRLLAFQAEEGGTPRRTVPSINADLCWSSRRAWDAGVEACLGQIRSGRLSKAVLARTLDVIAEKTIDPIDVVDRLWDARDESHLFLIEPEAGAVLVGAAPETVATLRKGRFFATAVAGSSGRGRDPEDDDRLGAALLASGKDREEHRLVVQDIVERLEAVCGEVEFERDPHVLTLARIRHLESRIVARSPADLGVLELLKTLHPTPAVCGVPRREAMSALDGTEPFARGWYAGPVGWFDSEGDGSFVPALRTGVSTGRRWRLYAGAGIVAGSDAESEWRETAMKFLPMLDALRGSGLAPAASEGPQGEYATEPSSVRQGERRAGRG